MKTFFNFPTLVVAGAVIIFSLGGARDSADEGFAGFAHLPTLVNGRIKPMDTVARTSLLALQGRQRVKTPDGRTLSPTAWLLDVLYRPEAADTYPVFEIVHPEVLMLFDLTPEQGAGGKRFAYTQLAKGLAALDRQAKLADDVESALRSSFQRNVIQLRDRVVLYQRLETSLVPPGVDNYLEKLLALAPQLPSAVEAARTRDAAGAPRSLEAELLTEMSRSFATLETLGYLLPIPPETEATDPLAWKSSGASLQQSLSTGHINPAALTYARLGVAWRADDVDDFATDLRSYREQLDHAIPDLMFRCDIEAGFNAVQPFYTSMLLYVAAFVIAVCSWLKWPKVLGQIAATTIMVAFAAATAGLFIRMWLEGRPPVTNLYSSALFVGWAAVALCLVIEFLYRNAIGSVAAGLIGFATLLIAHHLSLSGDTMEMMRAVLDSNFWLATHVVTVTVGYSATFLAGFLGLIYVFRGVFTRSLDVETAASLNRMIYGVVCFATLFSFVGTVLGGIWADQSWGRFWGWDPKENGALLIVMWNSIILHARWGGLVRQRGLANLAIFGNIVTSWSWFGVNMLGVGLHSYGFMDSAFWWLLGFVGAQVLAIAIAAIPMEKWRSASLLNQKTPDRPRRTEVATVAR